MKILILGYSELFKKRILKVLVKKKIKFCIASKKFSKKEGKAYAWFRDYDQALKNSGADMVYISLPNSLHYKWAFKALNKKYHVIVDKPICKNFFEAKKLVDLAKKKGKLLVEAIFYNYHSQFVNSLKIIKKINFLQFLKTNFIIPMPSNNSFRMSKKMGGGCLMDMGPYAASVNRLFGSRKLEYFKSNIRKNKNGLITSFDVYCKFNNYSYFGYFKFGGEYKNNMILFTKKKNIEINNVFSPPYHKKLNLLVKQNNVIKKIKIKKDDIFLNFFKDVLTSLKRKRFNKFYKIILQDAKFRDKLNG